MTDDPVDIVILAFNRLAHLVRMVDAIEERTTHPHRITIVDNGSEADVRAWLHANRHRFHQVIFNQRNEHLAGLQRGIERTTSRRYVVSDADLIPPDPVNGHCWLGELDALMDRHEDFGMIGCRIEGLPMPAWHRIGGPDTKVVDDELIEGPTGVWLNMIDREALRVPFESDGMTCHALGRAGYRVAVGVNLRCEHLGDDDPVMFPDYLARKNAANGFRSVYIEYPELESVRRPPRLEECALAAPFLAELEHPELALELGTRLPMVSAVEPAVAGLVLGDASPMEWEYAAAGNRTPLADRAVDSVVVCSHTGHDVRLVDEACRLAARQVLVMTPAQTLEAPAGFTLSELRPPNDAVLAMARWADRARAMKRVLGYTTLERHQEWLSFFEGARFGARTLRLYRLERDEAGAAVGLTCSRCNTAPTMGGCECGAVKRRVGARPYTPPFGRSWLGAVGAKLTQALRAVATEFRLRRR